MYNTVKNKINNKVSYNPKKVIPDTNGNKKTSSISYSKKNTHIIKNCIDTLIGFWVWGLKPHS
jgi:hypothetical protein